MLGRLFTTRLKAAENALRQGRLNEAYRIATTPDIREHRRGTALLQKLAERFVERARQHFAADRFAEALRDLDRAETGSVLIDRIRELRDQINTVANEAARQEQSRRDRLADARRRIADGSLQGGRRVLDAASEGDAAAVRMKRDIEMRDHEASEVFDQVRRLIRDGQWISAVERFAKGRALDPQDPACARLEAELCTRILKNTRQSIKDGRVRRAADELACLGELGQGLPARREVEEMLRLVKQAGESLRSGDCDGARQSVMRLQHLAPEIGWVSKAVKHLGAIDGLVTSLRAGPLGAFEDAPPPAAAPRKAAAVRAANLAETVAVPAAPRAGDLPDRLLLLVDGGGSYLLLRKDRVCIGRAATSNPADIPIFADLADRHADIARVEDGYFLFSRQEAGVEGRVRGATAVAERRPRGPGSEGEIHLPAAEPQEPECYNRPQRYVQIAERRAAGRAVQSECDDRVWKGFHIQCQMARNPLVLFERSGRLWVRRAGRGRAAPEAAPIEIGKTVEIDGVSMVAKPWSVRPGGSSRV